MKKVFVAACLSFISDTSFAETGASCQSASGKFITPLVELYTSEGCSSCPPADVWMSQQIRRKDIKANYLAFHVDYWDDIGWPDRFASPDYTRRQQTKVQLQGSNTVYTPQVMIGEQTRVSWYWPDRSESHLRRIGAELAIATISLKAQGKGAHWNATVDLSTLNAIPGAQWYLAVYQDGLSSQVRAGENKGRLLRHDRVVRQWLGPYRLNGTSASRDFKIALSSTETSAQTGLLAVMENSANGQVLQTLKLPLSQCKTVASIKR